jgi:hypothetical protein
MLLKKSRRKRRFNCKQFVIRMIFHWV